MMDDAIRRVYIGGENRVLPDYREAAVRTARELGFSPMVLAAENDAAELEEAHERLEVADLYIGLTGLADDAGGNAFDQDLAALEFDYAGERGISRLVFFPDESLAVSSLEWVDADELNELADFQARVREAGEARFFISLDDFREQLREELLGWKEQQAERALRRVEQIGGASAYLVRDPADVPRYTRRFVARESLLEVAEGLLDGNDEVLLQGGPGAGKSALAAEIAARWLAERSGAVVWLNAGNGDADALYLALLRAFDQQVTLAGERGVTVRKQTLRLLFEANGVRLLVVDNVNDPQAIEELLRLMPPEMPVLVTGRDDLPVKHVLPVGELTQREALEILGTHARRGLLTDPDAAVLSERLGFQPLALEIAGRTLYEDNLSPHDLLANMQTVSHSVVLPAGVGVGEGQSMAELLELTMRALDEETRRVFAGFGMLFAPVATPELLSLVLEFDVKAVSQALRTLERRGLAEQEPRTEERAERYSIDEAGFAYAATLTHAGDKYRALAACLDYVDRYKYKRSFFRLHAEMANLMGAAGWALRNGLYDEVRALADDLYRGPAPNSELGFFDLQGYFGPAADLMEMAAEAAHSQRDKLARAGYTGNMGSALRDMGHYDRAARVYGRARTLFRRIENRHGEGISLARLGIVDAMRGRPQDAYQTLTDALDVVREVGDKRWEAIVLNSLGSVHRELFSDFDELEVIEYHREALIIAIEIRDRRIEGTSLQKLGTVYRIMRDSEKAISYLERALDIAREVRDKQAESTSLGNLGLTFRDRGEYRKALNYLNKSLQISREIGSKHGEGIDLGGLGTVYEKMGELERAKHYYQLSLDVERSLRNWRGKAINLRRLGDICRRQDMLGAAVDYYEEALAVARRYDDPLGIVINLSRLGDAHHKLGNHDVALSYLEEAVQRRHEDGAEDDANWQAADLVTLGQVRRDLGEFESALDSLRAARDISAEMGLTGTVQDLNRDIIALKKVVGDGRRPTAGILMPDGETDEEQERFIFMSYAREDTVIMRRLRDALVRRGLNVWTDEQLEPGLPSWQREIERVIPTAGAVIALFSPDAKVSEWVNEELNFAVIHGVRIFPVLVRGSERTSVPFGHSRRQYVDFRDDSFFETSIEQISEALRNHMRL